MKKITNRELRIILRSVWPDADIRIPDRSYILPTRHRIWDELVSSFFEDYSYQAEILDCDDYALLLHAWIRQQQYREQWPNPLAFGEVWSKTHALNIVVLDDKTVHLVEPQTDAFITPDAHDIVFVRM